MPPNFDADYMDIDKLLNSYPSLKRSKRLEHALKEREKNDTDDNPLKQIAGTYPIDVKSATAILNNPILEKLKAWARQFSTEPLYFNSNEPNKVRVGGRNADPIRLGRFLHRICHYDPNAKYYWLGRRWIMLDWDKGFVYHYKKDSTKLVTIARASLVRAKGFHALMPTHNAFYAHNNFYYDGYTGRILVYDGDNFIWALPGQLEQSHPDSSSRRGVPPEIEDLLTKLTSSVDKKADFYVKISTEVSDVIRKTAGRPWSSCEDIGGEYDGGIYTDIAQCNAIAYIYTANSDVPVGRIMLRWGIDNNNKHNIGIENVLYTARDDVCQKSKQLREAIWSIIQQKGFGDYTECTTPYRYAGYSDCIGTSGRILFAPGIHRHNHYSKYASDLGDESGDYDDYYTYDEIDRDNEDDEDDW